MHMIKELTTNEATTVGGGDSELKCNYIKLGKCFAKCGLLGIADPDDSFGAIKYCKDNCRSKYNC